MRRWWVALALALAVAPNAIAWAQDPGEGEDEYEVGGATGEDGAGEGEGAADGASDGASEGEGLPPPPPRAVAPDDAQRRAAAVRREELGKSAYAFCHDDDFKPNGPFGDKRFCKTWSPAAFEACPAARKMCEERESSKPWSLELPAELGWAILAVVIAIILYFFGRALAGKDWRSTDDIDLGTLVEDAIAGEIQALPEAPAQVILRKAAEALSGGRVEEGAVLIQLACLRYFDDTGLAAFHPSRTNGEYLRALRRRSQPHHELYRRIALETDRVRFGSGYADASAVDGCLTDARALLAAPPPPDTEGAPFPAALLVMLALSLGLSQPGCGDSEKPFYSHRPAGMAALPAMLRELGFEVEVARKSFTDIPVETAVIVLESSAASTFDKPLLDDILDRGIDIIVLDDAHRAPQFLPVRTTSTSAVINLPGLGTSLSLGPESPTPEEVFVNDDVVCGIDLSRADALLERRLQLPRGERLHERHESATGTTAVSAHPFVIAPVLLVEDGRAEMAARAFAGVRQDKELGYYREGCLLVFSEGDLFSNASLALPQNAQFVAALFASLTPEKKNVLLLDGIRQGSSTDEGISRSVADSRMLPFILQGLLWVAVLFVFLGAAFGTLRDPVRVHHKAFVEHVEALGRQYARLGNAGLTHIARSLAKYLVMRHRAEVRSGWTTIARHLAEKHGLPEEDVSTAFRLGLEGVHDLGGAVVTDEAARSEPVLRALSVLITGRARVAPKKKARRR